MSCRGAKDFLAPLNSCLIDPAKKIDPRRLRQERVAAFGRQPPRRIATAYSHRYYWENIIEPRSGSTSLREFSTARVQQLLDEIARQNPEMIKGTLEAVRSRFSARSSSTRFSRSIARAQIPRGRLPFPEHLRPPRLSPTISMLF